MFRVIAHVSAAQAKGIPFDLIVLDHAERRLRRKLLTLQHGDEVLLDFPATVTLAHRDRLELEDGRSVEIIAADEPLLEVRGSNPEHFARLAWHLGNRHLPVQIEGDRILVRRDHIIRTMLAGLGASLTDVTEPFSPEHGAYHAHAEQPHALSLR